ncbi:DUF192 domain-containing protein [Candidatus Woesearchaeota archaeon]|nr:DUF192 domain-containing protein [Candidatus Woesearchaeota archaeon]
MKTATNILSKTIGLMFRTKITPLCFIFRKEAIHPIHSFFVFNNFEAIYLDKNKQVVDIKAVKPFQLNIQNNQPAKYLIEAPIGWSKQNNLSIGKIYKNRLQ